MLLPIDMIQICHRIFQQTLTNITPIPPLLMQGGATRHNLDFAHLVFQPQVRFTMLEVSTFRPFGPRCPLFGRLEFFTFSHEAWLFLFAFPGGFLLCMWYGRWGR